MIVRLDMKNPLILLSCLMVVSGCSAPEKKDADTAPKASKHEVVVSATASCLEDKACSAHLDKDYQTFKDADNLGSCNVWKAIGCGTLVAATAVACVDPLDGVCEEALVEDRAAGCCDCLPKGKVRDLCKKIPAEAAPGTDSGTETVTVPSGE